MSQICVRYMVQAMKQSARAAMRFRGSLAILTWAIGGFGCSPAKPAMVGNPPAKVPANSDTGTVQTKSTLGPAGRAMASRLQELRARLDTVTQCEDTCCAKGYTEFRFVGSDEPGLREVLRSNEPAPVRGLAAIHLRNMWNYDLDVIEDLDTCVNIEQTAGVVPDDNEPQQVQSWCPGAPDIYQSSLSWSAQSLGALCLKTANSFTSMELTPEQYRAWRTRYPNPRDSLEMWQARFRSRRPIDEGLLTELERHSRELYVRALLTHPEGLAALGVEPGRVASRLPGTVTVDELLGLLQDSMQWPELADTDHRDALAQNLFTYWRVLLGVAVAPKLEALWDRDFAKERPLVRYCLALAVADAIPARRRAILEQALSIPVYRKDALERLASEFASEEEQILVQWFKPPHTSEFPQEAILDGLARANPPPRHLFRKIIALIPSGANAPIQEAAINAALIQHAAATGVAVGCKLPPSTCQELSPWTGKRNLSKKDVDKEYRRAASAQRNCHAALRHCTARW